MTRADEPTGPRRDHRVVVNGKDAGVFTEKVALQQGKHHGVAKNSVQIYRVRPGKSDLLIRRWENGRGYDGR